MRALRVLVTGGAGRLASEIGRAARGRELEVHLPTRTELDVSCLSSIEGAMDGRAPDVVIHAAAALQGEAPDVLSSTNIVGTANIVTACRRRGSKLIYISTDFVYPQTEGPHSESDPLLPFTDYGWSKLGGECVVRMYENSLIIRGAFLPVPFPHDLAYVDVVRSAIYQDEAAESILDLLDEKGVINLGSSVPLSLHELAVRTRDDVSAGLSPKSYAPKRLILKVSKPAADDKDVQS